MNYTMFDYKAVAVIGQQILSDVENFLVLGGDAAREFKRIQSRVNANAYIYMQNGDYVKELSLAFKYVSQSGAKPYQWLDYLSHLPSVNEYLEAEYVFLRMMGYSIAIEAAYSVVNQDIETIDQAESLKNDLALTLDDQVLIAADNADYEVQTQIMRVLGGVMQYLESQSANLARVVKYRYGAEMPVLAISQRLYADSEKADQLAKLNQVKHSAFMPIEGLALSK